MRGVAQAASLVTFYRGADRCGRKINLLETRTAPAIRALFLSRSPRVVVHLKRRSREEGTESSIHPDERKRSR